MSATVSPAEPQEGAPLCVLVADDDPISRSILLKHVQSWGFGVASATNGSDAWTLLKDPETRIAILDWEMPGANGPDLCSRIRAESKVKYTYIFLLTSRDDPSDIIAGLEAGADDYMTKPVKFPELRARLRTGRRIVELEDKLLDSQKRLYELATRDGLTRLWNRRTIIQFLDGDLAHGHRQSQPTSVIMIDVDHFKSINDTCGHLAGDKVLMTLARRLESRVRPYDRIGRYGGDEILIVLPDCGLADAAKIAERLRRECVRKPASLRGQPFAFTLSIGCASSEAMARPTSDRMIHSGDQALYEAKRLGRNRVVVSESKPAAKGRLHARKK